jgi:hypothetical protein
MERVEPGGASEPFAAILPSLEEVAAGIALPEDALEAAPQELLVAELRRVPPAPAIIPQEPESRLAKRFVHHHFGEG